MNLNEFFYIKQYIIKNIYIIKIYNKKFIIKNLK